MNLVGVAPGQHLAALVLYGRGKPAGFPAGDVDRRQQTHTTKRGQVMAPFLFVKRLFILINWVNLYPQ